MTSSVGIPLGLIGPRMGVCAMGPSFGLAEESTWRTCLFEKHLAYPGSPQEKPKGVCLSIGFRASRRFATLGPIGNQGQGSFLVLT